MIFGKQVSKLFFYLLSFFIFGCSILQTRPVQLMADTAAAIKAAREVQADTLAPELFRNSSEWFFRAKNQYKLKNFKLSKEYAEKAKRFAEEAELSAIQGGANRSDLSSSESSESDSKTSAYPYPSPTGYMPDKFEDLPALPSPSPNTAPSPSVK